MGNIPLCDSDLIRKLCFSECGGIEALVRHVASAWGKQNIRANAMAPGFVMTPQIQASLPVEFREQMLKGTRHARLGEPSDIASMVAMLVSDEGAWIQGQSVGVNGGASFF